MTSRPLLTSNSLLCIQMDLSFWFDAINFGKATVHTLGCQVIVFKSSVFCLFFLSEDLFYITNSIDLDEMPHNVEFHLGLHCL